MRNNEVTLETERKEERTNTLVGDTGKGKKGKRKGRTNTFVGDTGEKGSKEEKAIKERKNKRRTK